MTEIDPATETGIEMVIATGIGIGTTDSGTTNEEIAIEMIEGTTVTAAVLVRGTVETDPLLPSLPTPRLPHRLRKRRIAQLHP